LRQNVDVPRTGTYTILRMCRVFAVNAQTDRVVDEKGQEVNARTVSLLVKPKQSEKLTLAAEMGKIRLALRRPTDKVPDDDELDAELPAIFRGDHFAIDKEPKKTEPTPPTPAPVPVVQTPVVVPEVVQPALPKGPEWTMQVMSPNEVRHFEWHDAKGLPQESSTGNSVPGAPSESSPASEEPVSTEASSGSAE
jgi:Flp pilus assembly protein CpaB